MNNPFLNPEDIISGTESAYIINEPLPVLNLYDRLKSDHKLALNKICRGVDFSLYYQNLNLKTL